MPFSGLPTGADKHSHLSLRAACHQQRVSSSTKAFPTPTPVSNLAFLASVQELAAFPHSVAREVSEDSPSEDGMRDHRRALVPAGMEAVMSTQWGQRGGSLTKPLRAARGRGRAPVSTRQTLLPSAGFG